MTTATLAHIGTPSEPWGDNNLVFIDLAFTDHEPATLTTNEQGKAARLADLNALLNKPAEWNFGTNSKGKPTVKIHKADGFGGGGKKGGWQPKSPEERAEAMTMSALSIWAHVVGEDRALLLGDLLAWTDQALRTLHATATELVKASGAEEPSVTGKGATASSVPDDNVEAERETAEVQARADSAASTTTSGASTPLDATPDRDGDGTTKPQEPPSAGQPEQGGAVSSRHVHEWKDAPRDGFVLCGVCGIARKREDVEVSASSVIAGSSQMFSSRPTSGRPSGSIAPSRWSRKV